MFIYPKRDEVFYDRIAGYLKAGIDAGEMCVCASPVSVHSMLSHMQALGVDTDHAVKTGQLAVLDSEEVYLNWGILDVRRATAVWTEKIEKADKLWNGVRIFGDTKYPLENRTARLKLLEYESKVNIASSRMSMALCGYQSSITPRALLVQMKSVHPFLASTRSIKTNHSYVEPARFLSTFYRFRRVPRVYPAAAENARECRRHFEEIAARTPMMMTEMEDMKLALGEAFANALEHGCEGLPADQCHIHVRFSPNTAGFTIEVRDHGNGFTTPCDGSVSQPLKVRRRGIQLMSNLVSEVHIQRRRSDTVITLHLEYSCPWRN